MELRAASTYVHELRPRLGPAAFIPARSRLLWVPFHLAMITVAMVAVARGWIPWPLVPLISLAIGVGFAGLTFVAHEALHGGIVRNKRLAHVAGWIGFAPFLHSPKLWKVWHNREHHGHTSHPVRDPDTYPTLSMYKDSPAVRTVTDSFSLGGRRWTGALSLILGNRQQGTAAQHLCRGRDVGGSRGLAGLRRARGRGEILGFRAPGCR